MSGGVIVLEGPDGAGKSTLGAALVPRLEREGIRARLVALPGNESGTLGYLVHRLHHDAASLSIGTIHPASLQLLHAAAHLDAIYTTVRPAIEAGETIVMDRFWWSTIVYGRAAGVDEVTLSLLEQLARRHWAFTIPTIAYVFLSPPAGPTPDVFQTTRSRYMEFLDGLNEPFPVVRVEDQQATSDDRAGQIVTAWLTRRHSARS